MKKYITIFVITLAVQSSYCQLAKPVLAINLFGDSLYLPFNSNWQVPLDTLSDTGIQQFYSHVSGADIEPLVSCLLQYKAAHNLNDWLYYQLIRKTANAISPKIQNYHRYTLYKWLLLTKSDYDAVVRIISSNRLLFYVRSDDSVYNIPSQVSNGKQYVCLNYHDYNEIDVKQEKAFQRIHQVPGANMAFSYRVTQLPSFGKNNYVEKELNFTYQNQDYNFKIKLNPVVKDIFANYPVVDFESFFNIPLSTETYSSLMPGLKTIVGKLDQQAGIDYLMHFTRYAFPFKKDMEQFGKEKRLAPEETLLYTHSDCEDRAALFFYLVKEIYNLPMITMLYPEHVTIAIALPKPGRKTILYNGKKYTVCEPTPQGEDLEIGQLPYALRHAAYTVGYEYVPVNK